LLETQNALAFYSKRKRENSNMDKGAAVLFAVIFIFLASVIEALISDTEQRNEQLRDNDTD
jgi:hypothetical protein